MTNLGNLLILGDSYSTFEGYIPDGYSAYYKSECSYSDVSEVEETWWHQLVTETGSHLLLNTSFSGSTICNTGYNGNHVPHTSFLGRIKRLISKNYFAENRIDTIIIFGGTNDSWADSPIGELQYADWTDETAKCVLPAFCQLLSLIKENAPDARILKIINTELKDEITDGIAEACQKFGVETVKLCDIDKAEGHPTVLGMKQIKEQIINHISQ